MTIRKKADVLKEQYYTKPIVAKKLVEIFNAKEGFEKFKYIIEPSAGSGNFLKNIPRSNKRKVIGLDLYPNSNVKSAKIKKQDFLTWTFPYKISTDKVLCIGNPPFGRQSGLAKKFIKKCSEFSDHIAFILPKAFESRSFKKSLPTDFHKKWSIHLPNGIFVDRNGSEFNQSLNTIFVYYTKTNNNATTTRNKKVYRNNGLWELKKKNIAKERNSSDFRIIRASGNPGRAISIKDPKFKIKGKTYNDYYIKILTPIRRSITHIIRDVNNYRYWKFHNTTTFKSIDKQQLTKVLNKITSKYEN